MQAKRSAALVRSNPFLTEQVNAVRVGTGRTWLV